MEGKGIVYALLLLLASLLLYGCVENAKEESIGKLEQFNATFPFSKFPPKYTCDGEDVSPPIVIANPPNGTCCYAVYMYDNTTPNKFVHWVAWNIYADGNVIREGVSAPSDVNNFGRKGYGGPCPPYGEHIYILEVYALKSPLEYVPANPLEARGYFSTHTLGIGIAKATYERNES